MDDLSKPLTETAKPVEKTGAAVPPEAKDPDALKESSITLTLQAPAHC